MVVGHATSPIPASHGGGLCRRAAAWGSLDFLVHAIAFSDKDQLDGRYVDTTEDNFIKTMLVSCYSFTAYRPARRKADDQRRLEC